MSSLHRVTHYSSTVLCGRPPGGPLLMSCSCNVRSWLTFTVKAASSMPPRTFTPSVLTSISRALKPPSLPPIIPPHTQTTASNRPPTDAAVLIPLMNINSEPHILMELRASSMRVHAGEARWGSTLGSGCITTIPSISEPRWHRIYWDSFPGGKADDVSCNPSF